MVFTQATGITAIANLVPVLMGSGIGSAVILRLMAALIRTYLGTDHFAEINVTVAFYFIFGAFSTSTIECTAYVYGSEIWPTHLLSEGSTYASFFGNVIAYSAPVSVALNIGWKFYLVFVAITFVSTLVIMFHFPETKNLTSEEMNAKLGDKVPIELEDAVATEKHVVVESQQSA
ncbi:putative Major facilitator superfamily (MFS) profile domain-containing protein [Seiridium unicorne]|uniref:Major facilitator superfamily (MFS) profile domain-containing protein n=1 Tax=Seiridium unicorne TaxID=138068 RepID=A0ABR2V8C5_9PEZI